MLGPPMKANTITLQDLPSDVISVILNNLPQNAINNLSTISKSMATMINKETRYIKFKWCIRESEESNGGTHLDDKFLIDFFKHRFVHVVCIDMLGVIWLVFFIL